MFGLDFAVDGVLDQFCDWIYGKLITFFGEFFSMINMMGAELFELDWIKAILLFFYYFAWALYIVGIVVAVFDTAIEAQRGKGSFQDLALNIIKGFFAVSLFTVVPIDLYVFCINLSNELIGAIAGMSIPQANLVPLPLWCWAALKRRVPMWWCLSCLSY